MKNITLAIDEGVLAEARRYAIENGTTVNGMVRDYLGRVASARGRAKEAMRELREMSDRTRAETGPITWTRDELYER